MACCYNTTCDRRCESAVVVTLLAFWVMLIRLEPQSEDTDYSEVLPAPFMTAIVS